MGKLELLNIVNALAMGNIGFQNGTNFEMLTWKLSSSPALIFLPLHGSRNKTGLLVFSKGFTLSFILAKEKRTKTMYKGSHIAIV